MDAAEHDLDAKLYKASGTLLPEIQHKLDLLIFRTDKSIHTRRLYVLDPKCAELGILLDRFQEWPQLLDPLLSNLVQVLSDAFIGHLTTSSEHYSASRRSGTTTISPLPRAICRLLYSLCKVRGYKVIVRLLNNEPRYLAPMLSKFRAWNNTTMGMTWEERYIFMLWLSHLVLAPFELADMSVSEARHLDERLAEDIGDFPGPAGDTVSLAFEQLDSSGKEREAASILLVRLSLRKDMQARQLTLKLVNYAMRRLLFDDDIVMASPYKALGFLGLIYGISNSSSDSEAATYLEDLFQSILKVATDQRTQYIAIRDSAPARKLILKILRSILTHSISLNSRNIAILGGKVTAMVEEGIQYFLDSLSDKDTPVRMTAAKSLSVVTLKLGVDMSTEVVDAVLACLEENVLLEHPHNQKLVPITDNVLSETTALKRNISAVDPLRWHGLMLTLSHLLFRRSPPPDTLPEIIQALILGLEFEQRSNVGTSVGVSVRDAACFGLWALARKYSTSELGMVPMSHFAEATLDEYADCQSVLQLIAIKLTICACLDPSGNIRRGSSAALQELIGRHPDTVIHGIAIVQVVDYHAVARLSRGMIEVTPQAAALDQAYLRPLLQGLIDWRGARATDVNQRRWAATAVHILAKSLSESELLSLVHGILQQLLDLKQANIGSTAGARHGLLLALTSALEAATGSDTVAPAAWLADEMGHLFALSKLTGKMDGRVTADLELVMEATSTLAGRICRCFAVVAHTSTVPQEMWMASVSEVLEQCTVTGGRDAVVQTCANANVELFKILPHPENVTMIEKWLDMKQQSLSTFASRGRIRSLSLVYAYLAQANSFDELQQSITSYIITIIEGGYKIETRVDAMEALGVILHNMEICSAEEAINISSTVCCGLIDYSNDQRGDIGSTLRLQSIETVDAFRENKGSHPFSGSLFEAVMPYVVKLAAEKLNNVRFRAWKCLQSYWHTNPRMPELKQAFEYPADVSSVSYFQQLMALLALEWSRKYLLLGIVSSATSGTEDICRAASNAFVSYLQALDTDRRESLVQSISSVILDQIETNATQEDRQLVPFLVFSCFMMDKGLFAFNQITPRGDVGRDIWAVMAKAHGAASSLPRIEASLNLYSRLLSIDQFRLKAMDKLTRQLLHRWPKVRNTAADLLYLDSPTTTLASCDWNAPTTEIKPVVLQLRKQLGVAGSVASKS